jgi:hypothetical protein
MLRRPSLLRYLYRTETYIDRDITQLTFAEAKERHNGIKRPALQGPNSPFQGGYL